MPYSDQLEEKLRTYLGSLSPQAVEGLVRNIERAKTRNDADPHLHFILTAAVSMLRKPQASTVDMPGGEQRRGQIQRIFFSPLDDFLINEVLKEKQEGRIHRGILTPVWTWLCRDVMSADVQTVLEQAGNATISGERVDLLVHALRSRAVDVIGEHLDSAEASEKDHRKLAAALGGMRGLEELKDIHKIFAAERWLLPFLKNIPGRINDARLKRDTDVLRLVDSCTERFPEHVPLVAAALLDRAENPASLCAFAGRLNGDSDAKAIERSQFAPFMDVVLSEAERLQMLAMQHRENNPDPVAFSTALSEYHKLVKGVERDMDLSVTGKWHKQLAETKKSVSSAVTRELNGAHVCVRRALQVPKVDKNGAFEQDQVAIDEAVRALRVVTMVRNASETFAVNEIGKRTQQAVEQTLEILTRSLISDIEKTRGPQLKAQVAAADTAIMLCEIYYGEDYAAQLKRSKHSALAKAEKKKGGVNKQLGAGRNAKPHIIARR